MEVFSIPLPDLPIPSVKCELTFEPYLKYLEEQQANTKSSIYKIYLESIIKLLKDNPVLLNTINDLQVLEDHKELTELLKITHLSQVAGENPLHSLGIPSSDPLMMNYFSSSLAFKSFFQKNNGVAQIYSEEHIEELIREMYLIVLYECYNIGDEENYPTDSELQVIDTSQTIKKYYKIIRRNTFADIIPLNALPQLNKEWVEYAQGNISLHAELKDPLPFNEFVVRGFFLFSIEDDTEEFALNQLSDTIAKLHTYDSNESFYKMKDATLSLLGVENIEVGFLPFFKVNDKYAYHQEIGKISVVFNSLKSTLAIDELSKVFNFVAEKCEELPTIQSSLNKDLCQKSPECEEEDAIVGILTNAGLAHLTFVPIWNQDTLLGVIEVGSRKSDAIDKNALRKLEAAAPFYREFFIYKSGFFDEYMKSFIMNRYTSIQPSVRWKFNDVVWDMLKEVEIETEEVAAATPAIKFDNLYPFYGAVDYRNSSAKQLQAIHSDYLLQLDYLRTLLEEDEFLENKSVVGFLNTISAWERRVEGEIEADEEYELRRFLEQNAVTFLKELFEQDRISEDTYKLYVKAASSKTGIFHLSHNDYENSMQQLNGILKTELNKAQNSLAKVVPHYFEKFQTDGVEYSLYAGKSINPNIDFPENITDIVAEWQVETMVRLATATYEYKNNLSVPLETTQLILIHENKVDISYRVDEKHFDVEGAYSIRYEVMKKRIDKARLLNSNERLTQPGKIAIVYAHLSSCKPYLDKIEELISAGEIEKGIEYLDLEQMQGIGKLKAIRVKINFNKGNKVQAKPSTQAYTK
ncbi:MAG: hypothetical protein R2800_09265 [Flavipsychrobacter sp.]